MRKMPDETLQMNELRRLDEKVGVQSKPQDEASCQLSGYSQERNPAQALSTTMSMNEQQDIKIDKSCKFTKQRDGFLNKNNIV